MAQACACGTGEGSGPLRMPRGHDTGSGNAPGGDGDDEVEADGLSAPALGTGPPDMQQGGTGQGASAPALFSALGPQGIKDWIREHATEWLGPNSWTVERLTCKLLKFARDSRISNAACLSLFRILNEAAGSDKKGSLPSTWAGLKKMLKEVLVTADKWYACATNTIRFVILALIIP